MCNEVGLSSVEYDEKSYSLNGQPLSETNFYQAIFGENIFSQFTRIADRKCPGEIENKVSRVATLNNIRISPRGKISAEAGINGGIGRTKV